MRIAFEIIPEVAIVIASVWAAASAIRAYLRRSA